MISKQLKPSSITKKTFLYPSFFFCLFIFNFFLYFFRVSWYLCICVHMCMCVKNLNIIFTKMYKVDLSFDFCSFDFFDKDLSIFFSFILRFFFLFYMIAKLWFSIRTRWFFMTDDTKSIYDCKQSLETDMADYKSKILFFFDIFVF